jgi:hypothetical protein
LGNNTKTLKYFNVILVTLFILLLPSVSGCKAKYQMNITSSPDGGGVVTSTTGTDPAKPSASPYKEGTVVTLTAVPSEGYRFLGWEGDAAGDTSSVVVTMDTVKNITARFIALYALNVSSEPANGGSVSPADGIYDDGSTATITASPASGYRFDGFSGDAAGDSSTIAVTMDNSKNITAHFVLQHTLKVLVQPSESGTVTPVSSVIDEGSDITITAVAGSGYRFTGWSGYPDEKSSSLTLTMDADKTITANFIALYSLTTHLQPDNGGTVAPASGIYDAGTEITLKANPSPGFRFDHWVSGPGGKSNIVTVKINSNIVATAQFIALHNLTISTLPSASGTVSPPAGAYDEGTPITLTAVPAQGYLFSHWGGDATGSSNFITITISDDKNVTAEFLMFYSPALSGVITGTGIQAAAPYAGNKHPMILIGYDGAEHEWSNQISTDWLPTGISDTQLVAVISEEKETIIETVPYDGPSIDRIQYSIDVVLRAANTGTVIASTTIRGTPPRQAMTRESYWLTQLFGEHVSLSQVTQWLESYFTR